MRLQTPNDCIPHPCWMYKKCLSTLRCCGWAYDWVHPYAVLHVQVGVNLRENGVWPSLYDVVVSWLRIRTPNDCIPHPYWMNKKCLSTLRCCGWAYGCTLTLLCPYRGGWIFRKIGAWLSPSDVVMSWLRLQTPSDCIPQPWHIYTMLFSTLRCCGWAYGGCTLMLIPLEVRGGFLENCCYG